MITTLHTAAETAATYARVGAATAATAATVLDVLDAAGRISVPGACRSLHAGS